MLCIAVRDLAWIGQSGETYVGDFGGKKSSPTLQPVKAWRLGYELHRS